VPRRGKIESFGVAITSWINGFAGLSARLDGLAI
jgi:hypothetical protein